MVESQQEQENPATFERIKAKLDEMQINYKLTTHAPVLTSQEAADIRGVNLSSGAKAMLLKDCGKKLVIEGAPFYLAILSASRRFSSKDFKKLINCKNIRFANTEEVLEVTGCITGAVPPFGSLFNKPTPTFVDESLSKEERINFNCGLRTHSVSMTYADYCRVEGITKVHNFTEVDQ